MRTLLDELSSVDGAPPCDGAEAAFVEALTSVARPENADLEADAAGCRFALAGDRSLVVTGDRELLRRACENVLRNAILQASGSHDDFERRSRRQLRLDSFVQ